MTKFLILTSILISSLAFGQQNQQAKSLELNQEINDLQINRNEEQKFNLNLEKDKYYSIIASQQGIDLVITLKDKNNKLIQEVDSPNGMFGPEKIVFSPNNSGIFNISVIALDEKENSQKGKYSIVLKRISKMLNTFKTSQLNQDFDMLKNALIETRVGLWYNSKVQFDSICTIQKNKIKENMNALDFYKIVAPIVAYTKEGHSNISLSDELSLNIKQNGKHFPFLVKILEGKVYLINDLDNLKTKGFVVTKINNNPIEKILETFLKIEPSDGFNLTSKYKWIETVFSKYYLRFFEFNPKSFEIELINPKTNEKLIYKNIQSYSFKDFSILSSKVETQIPNYSFIEPALFSIDKKMNAATLTINDMATNVYKNGRKGFQLFLENSFASIAEQNISNLIIDLRKCEGGTQGMEDHLLTYLIDKEYQKYKYVEIPAFNYSFIKYSNYNGKENELTDDLKTDFYQSFDGRFLNKKGHYEGEKPKAKKFSGAVYVLIGGLTFSGGSELASLIKNYTNAIFIGEETGGGYYGNTSGSFITYALSNTGLSGRIPLCKFAVETNKNEIPFGRGLLPDFKIQPTIEEYLNNYDAEMEYTKKLINK